MFVLSSIFEPCHEKTCLWGFRPGLTQTGLYSLKRGLKFGFRKCRDCTIYVAKTKALITTQPAPLFSHILKSRFSHEAAPLSHIGQ